ncbi:hypothetical protein PRIC2_000355 [Phytophthora ramorum]|uniref:SURP motif domain-containing protein n=1 Tax=Phytophthora ramorum TaxID=164328 RepID=H3GC56_PHYRM
MNHDGRGAPVTSAQLEQQFQARIAQAKEAARMASIAAAARGRNASNGVSFTSVPAVPGVPFRPPPVSTTAAAFIAPFAMENVPPDVRNRIDRLVDFVARNGDAFEATAKQRERDNPDFAFLRLGGPYSDYYQWKKQQMCSTTAMQSGFSSGFVPSPPPRAPFGSPNAVAAPPMAVDPMDGMSVGAMANVCKYARVCGVQAYSPIPQEVIVNVGSLPLVEPARLEIRLAEFYREEEKRRGERPLA